MNDRPCVVWDMTFAMRSMTGTRVYTQNLSRAIGEQGAFELRELRGKNESGPRRTGTLRGNINNILWLLYGAEQEIRRHQPALFHAAAYFGPPRVPCPSVVNVFDTTYLAFPQNFDWKWHLYARTVIPNSIKQAAAILTLSEHARGEITRAYQVPPERVHIVPPGIGAEFHPIDNGDRIDAVRARYKLGADYLLYVGGRNPRKNVPALIQAFARARQEFPALQFVIAGPRGHFLDTDAAVTNSGLGDALRELDFVPQEDLPLLYAGARASVFASKLEGFGIPPVEAMACGTPVVSAPNAPMPEVLGDAAWFTENDSPEALAAGIVRVLSDDSLARELRARGIRRAAMYSWDDSALKTIDVYRMVLAHQHRAP